MGLATGVDIWPGVRQSHKYVKQSAKVRGPETCDLLSSESANIESGDIWWNGQDPIHWQWGIHQSRIPGSSQM